MHSTTHPTPLARAIRRAGIILPLGGALLAASMSAQAFEFDDVDAGGKLHLDYAKHDEDRKELENGTMVRRARFGVEVTQGDWEAEVEYEFTDDGEFKDVTLGYEGFDFADLVAGQQKIPFGLEQQTSSSDLGFVERALPVGTFDPSRAMGLAAIHEGDRHTVTAMAFGDAMDSDAHRRGFGARATVAPVLTDTRLVHFGASAVTETTREELDLDSYPESRPTDEKFVNTGGIDNTDRINRYGLEAAWRNGPLSAQAEWLRTDVHRDGGDDNVDFDGWYVSGSWMLTGEVRPYDDGAFDSVEPEHDYGAWELVARVSQINLNDADVEGGRETNATLGVNWYVDDDLRLMANYINVDSKRKGKSDDPNILLMRVQMLF